MGCFCLLIFWGIVAKGSCLIPLKVIQVVPIWTNKLEKLWECPAASAISGVRLESSWRNPYKLIQTTNQGYYDFPKEGLCQVLIVYSTHDITGKKNNQPPCCHNREDVAGHLREGNGSLLEVLWVQWPSGKHLHPSYDIGWSPDGSSGCDCNSSGILVANPIPCKASHFHTFLPPTFHIKLAEVPRATPVWPPGFGMTRVVETDKMSSILHTAYGYWPFFQLSVFLFWRMHLFYHEI